VRGPPAALPADQLGDLEYKATSSTLGPLAAWPADGGLRGGERGYMYTLSSAWSTWAVEAHFEPRNVSDE
jgi:hypothetical protein